MMLPGFNAEASLHSSTNYSATLNLGMEQAVVPAAYPVGFETCFIPCFNYYMSEGMEVSKAISVCAIACGLSEVAVRAALLEYTGLYGAGSAMAEGAGIGLGAAAFWMLVAALAGGAVGMGIEYAITPDIPEFSGAKTCKTSGPHTVGTISGGWWGRDRALAKAQEAAEAACAALGPSYCAGSCPTGSCLPHQVQLINSLESGFLAGWRGVYTHIDYTYACECQCP